MSDIFEAIVAPVRRAILDELCERDGQTLFELCARLLMKHQISVTRQGVSQHLDILEAAGLIDTERQGRYKFHTSADGAIEGARHEDGCRRQTGEKRMVKIVLTSILVDDQQKALKFYTEKLGFQKIDRSAARRTQLADGSVGRRS